MKNQFLILIFFIFSVSLFSVIEETDSFRGFLYGSAPNCEYDNWLSHVAEGIASENYNLYAPFDRQTDGFGDYKIPSSADSLAWTNAVELFLAGELQLAQETLTSASIPYEVVIFHDTDYNRTYHILREIPNFEYFDDNGTPNYPDDDEAGAFDYGWGLYVYYPNGPFPHITTAPHPNDDFISVPMAYEVFTKQQSKFLLISGTGREVKWTEIGNYTNSKSLCDPSRVLVHPFNTAYHKFCDLIRNEFGQREFSIQVHSYDWGTRHPGKANVQISGGNQVVNPDLPIRDNSSLKLDIVNATDFVVHPANDIGIHSPVYINDFYAIHCNMFPFIYSNGDTTFAVNTDIDLPGYSSNRQMQYTQSGFNHYDNIEPFFHIEMDELPNIYPQVVQNYHWFYSWDPISQHFDYNHLFDKTISYYTPWVDALAEVLPYMYQMNDNLIPQAPTQPQIIGECTNNITLKWNPGDSYDIYSYEILLSDEPIENGNYQIIDRTDDYRLASLATYSKTFYGLQPNTTYYFKIRIKDKNNNFSNLTQEVEAFTGCANISEFSARGDSTYIELNWQAFSQNTCNGFNVYRKTPNSDYEQIASWSTNDSLIAVPSSHTYTFFDTTCLRNVLYTYKISSENNNFVEFFYQDEVSAIARYIGKLQFRQDAPFALSDTCYFGYNEMATDGYDPDYDIAQSYSSSGNYFFCQFYEANWNSNKTLLREIKGYYDSFNGSKSWTIRFRTNQLNVPVRVKLANYQARNTERIYLKHNNELINLGDGEEYTFTPTSTSYYTFTLYYGNYIPTVNFVPLTYILYYPNSQINFEWSIDNTSTIDHINLYAINDNFTIPIALNLNNQTTQMTWQAPTITADSLQLQIDIITEQSDTIKYISPYRFGIIFPQLSVSTQEGWSLISKNFETSSETTEEIYGENTLFYELQDTTFMQIDNPEFTKPYWLYSPQDYYHNVLDPELLRTGYQYTLHSGWNIIPNPFNVDFDISQLLFRINDNILEYYQAVSMRLIEAKFFEYNKEFKPIPYITAGKAYYLYCYADDIDILYIPYYNSSDITENKTSWDLKLTSSLAENPDKSAIKILGSETVSNNTYYPVFDLLKPTLKPFDNAPILTLRKSFGFTVNDYYQLIEKYEPALETVENIYDAKLIAPLNTDIRFDLDTNNLPSDYMIYLCFNGDYRQISSQHPVFLTADSTKINFQIYITNFEHVSSDNDLVQSDNKVYNYPNPFNPKTTIYFYNDTDNCFTKLSIYNLKGQFVKTLYSGQLKKGKQQVTWDGTNQNGKKVSSGVYFYWLKQGNKKTIIKKMLLLK